MSYTMLDTDVWSFLFKQDTRAEQYRRYLQGQILYISFQTVAELYQWAERANWGRKRREQLAAWLKRFVILGYDQQTGQIWGQIRAERARLGRQIAAQDAWVAACAMRHKYPLLSHNIADYTDLPQLILISVA